MGNIRHVTIGAMFVLISIFIVSAEANAEVSIKGDTVQIFGQIDFSTVYAIQKILSKNQPKRVVLNSPSGRVYSAFIIGRLIRQLNLATVVEAGHTCNSACFFIFIGGAERTVHGSLGVHQTKRKIESNFDTQVTTGEMLDYIVEMGIDPRVSINLLRTPPDKIYKISTRELGEYRITTTTVKKPETKMAKTPKKTTECDQVNKSYLGKSTLGKDVFTSSNRHQYQRAFLYVEPLASGSGDERHDGRTSWFLIKRQTETGLEQDTALFAKLEFPDREMVVTVLLRPNRDGSTPASHWVKICFELSKDDEIKEVTEVPGLVLKKTEAARGDALSSASARVLENLFWIALSQDKVERERNEKLLRARDWIDIPFRFNNKGRAIITFEKGNVGGKLFDQVFREWKHSSK